jgi:diketogulonate reductase-like aldo/keto reductase
VKVQKRPFGWLGIDVPVMGQGTWKMEHDDRRAVVAALRKGLDLGLTHIDTAELYGSGRVEERVGEAIEGRRDEVFLVSKVMPSNASSGGTIQACERTLRRLHTDRLDLYLLHWPGDKPLEDTIAAFEQLVRDGKIRAWGVSNFDVLELEEALSLAGENRIACNQVLYHLEERSIEHAVIPWCQAHGVAVVGYSPFGSGQFPAPSTRGGRALREVAEARGATARQVALRFLFQAKGAFQIPKASSERHVADNAGAGELVLSDAEMAKIDAAFPIGRARRGVPMI